MVTQPGDTPPSRLDDAGSEATRREERRHAERRTESQSAYLRVQHRRDAEPGDASADVHGVRQDDNRMG